MPKTDTSTAAPVTAAATFHSCNPAHQHLFAVRPGVSVADALEIASSLLASALSAVHVPRQSTTTRSFSGRSSRSRPSRRSWMLPT